MNTELYIKKIEYDEAKTISSWIYEEPYSIYNVDNNDESICEFISGNYFTVYDKENNLIGFFCFGESAQVPAGRLFGAYYDKNFTDIGLGIKPNLCGHGIGAEFLRRGLEFAHNDLSVTRFRLTVATFNKRAINVYERLGFVKKSSFERISDNGKVEFTVMTL